MADKLDRALADAKAELAAIDEQIESFRLYLADFEKQRDIAIARVDAFSLAVSVRPQSAPQPRKGRQPGAISQEWRTVLERVYGRNVVSDEPSTYQDILASAKASGIDTDINNVRERVRSFVANGLLTGTAEAGFFVTPEAVTRFNFDDPSMPEEPPEIEHEPEYEEYSEDEAV